MAKGAVDLDDQVMVFSLFPTSAFLCVIVIQINFKLLHVETVITQAPRYDGIDGVIIA